MFGRDCKRDKCQNRAFWRVIWSEQPVPSLRWGRPCADLQQGIETFTGKEDENMDLEKIAGLVKLIEDSSLKEFTYKEGDVKITMSKLDHPPIVAAGVPAMAGVSAPQITVPVQEKAEEGEEESLFITSPIVGTFYSASAPDVPAFVRVGDRVKEGQTVCILEAMKLMNEIQCEYDCEIEAVLVSNEQKVEYGQPLFRVKKI